MPVGILHEILHGILHAILHEILHGILHLISHGMPAVCCRAALQSWEAPARTQALTYCTCTASPMAHTAQRPGAALAACTPQTTLALALDLALITIALMAAPCPSLLLALTSDALHASRGRPSGQYERDRTPA